MGQEKLHSLLFLWLSLWAEQSCPSLVSASLVTPPKDMYIALGHLFSPRRTPRVLGSLSAVWMCEAEPSCSCVPASNHCVRPECSSVLPSPAEPAWVSCEGPWAVTVSAGLHTKEWKVEAVSQCEQSLRPRGRGRGGAHCLPQKHLQCLCS